MAKLAASPTKTPPQDRPRAVLTLPQGEGSGRSYSNVPLRITIATLK